MAVVGVGLDMVEIARVERLLTGKGERALHRLFTERELAYTSRRAQPARHHAVRLAAKEAAYKALAGNELARGIGWKELEIVSGWDGRPTFELHGRAQQRAAELGVTSVHVSLTHSETAAAAVVILESDRP
jgi:holo-[acyl-carrier protein] synthase